MKKIDTCGMSCPQPVLMTKKALEESPEGLDIIVDNNTAKGNVERFLKNSGYKVIITENEDNYILEARK
ncbi:MAG TPA: sulfurtransferase TusA family protein [Sedimentibacter sp.]|jgi:TusA-related sulfurtransferase|nr:sulfurtransferase TusA family protein [Sedimentibacter sp.]NLA14860.1 SirA family protein [Tissierellia bacterium]HAS92049.1 SirA family protein [Clostridiales bacterium]HOA20201.1 sulfurtransferase TusA family protein [Sedimentibacter sp.]HOG62399.1 sulfurtransferase TusA family protein [Sedimentibacter sp.]